MDWHNMNAQAVADALSTSVRSGLKDTEVKKRLERDGENRLSGRKRKSIIAEFFEQFKDFTVLILLAASAISFATSFLEEQGDLADPIIILVIVVLNAAIGVFQQRKAERSLEALKNMSAPTATVIRNSKEQKIEASQVVRGDIIVLHAGDLVPADARLIEAYSLSAQESALTGESVPSEKDAKAVLPSDSAQADMKNMLFSSTVITAGHGTAVVTETGMDTCVGKIAHLLNEEESPMTPLQIKLAKIGKALGLAAMGICALIFVLGVLRHAGLLNSFMLAVSLAVAAIPEGLPAVVTVVLSLGVQKMAKSNAIIRRLPAVETLGAATYICSDKTGTLTQNVMTVTALCSPHGKIDISSEQAVELLSAASLCCDAKVSGKNKVTGEPTEKAIVSAAEDAKINTRKLCETCPRVSENPFSSERKMMSVTVKVNGSYKLIAKGAPDVLLSKCTTVKIFDKIFDLTDERRKNILRLNENMARKALRVIAVAEKQSTDMDESESNLCFCGLIGMEDPPRKEVPKAVATCRKAGITPVMITGDHAVTACAIAERIGILGSGETCLTGNQIDRMSDEEFKEAVGSCRVYARVTPEHKVKIVKALRSRGEIVAMTGDGVNDAPALKAADIGCAMGKGGTEVAKNAADMILTDDNFATIVKAVAQGRGIYDNIRNIGEILCVFAATLFGMPAPLLPIQLLWINLVTDSLPALALGTEKLDKDIMLRSPQDSSKSFFANGVGLDIALEGMLIGALSLVAFVTGRCLFPASCDELGRTMTFAAQSLCEVMHSLNMRSRQSIFKIGPFSNKKLTVSMLVCISLQLAVMTVTPLANLFKVVPMDAIQWLTVLALAVAPVVVLEIGKYFTSLGEKRKKSKYI